MIMKRSDGDKNEYEDENENGKKVMVGKKKYI